MRILVAESDHFISSPLIKLLRNLSYAVDHATSVADTINMLKYYEYNLLITEMSLNDMEGYEIIRCIRRANISIPIMVISALMHPQGKVTALTAGADDYVIKPYDQEEMLARIQTLVRRSYGLADSYPKVGPFELNINGRMISINGQFLNLTNKEYAILELLILRRGSILTKEAFLNHLYGGIDEPEMKIIDVFICKLRRKLKRFNAENTIKTIWGRGYILNEEEKEEQKIPAAPHLSKAV